LTVFCIVVEEELFLCNFHIYLFLIFLCVGNIKPVLQSVGIWRSYHYSPSTYFPFCYLLWTVRIFSM